MLRVVNLFACHLKDARITSLDSRGADVYIGTSLGVLQRWQVHQEGGEGAEYVSRQLSQLQLKKRPVTQLVLDPEWSVIFTLCDEVVTAHSSANFGKEFQVMDEPKKNVMTECTRIAVAPVYKGTHRLCVATKRKLYLYRYKVPQSDRSGVRIGQATCDMFQKLMMPSQVLSLAFFGETLCCGYLKEYSLLNCYSGKATGLFTLTAQQPYVRLLDTEQATLCNVGSKSIWVSVKDSDLKGTAPTPGRLTRVTIRWSSEPKAVAFKHPYVIGLLAKSTEVYSIYEHAVVQSLPNISGATLSATQTPQRNDQVCIATDKAVFMMISLPVVGQIQALVQKLMMTEAFDLIKKNASGVESIDSARLNDTHIAAGFAFLFQAKPVSAFEHFAATDVDLCDILVHLPHMLPPDLLPAAVLSYTERHGEDTSVLYNTASLDIARHYITHGGSPPGPAELGINTLLDRYRRLHASAAAAQATGAYAVAASVPHPSSAQLAPSDVPSGSSLPRQSTAGGSFLDRADSCTPSEAGGVGVAAAAASEAAESAGVERRAATPSAATTPVMTSASVGNGTFPQQAVSQHSAEAESVLSHAVDSLMMFLGARRGECDPLQQRCTDYVILYVNVDRDHPESVFNLLSKPNACDLKDCVPMLEERGLYTSLALLYMSKGCNAEAARCFDRADPTRRLLLLKNTLPSSGAKQAADAKATSSGEAAGEGVAGNGGSPPEGGYLRELQQRSGDLECLRSDAQAIFMAVSSNRPEYVRSVLKKGREKGVFCEKQTDAIGNTPLHYAVGMACVAVYDEGVGYHDATPASAAEGSSWTAQSCGSLDCGDDGGAGFSQSDGALRGSSLAATSPLGSAGSRAAGISGIGGAVEQESLVGLLMAYGADAGALNHYAMSPLDVAKGASLKVWGMLEAINDLRQVCGDSCL